MSEKKTTTSIHHLSSKEEFTHELKNQLGIVERRIADYSTYLRKTRNGKPDEKEVNQLNRFKYFRRQLQDLDRTVSVMSTEADWLQSKSEIIELLEKIKLELNDSTSPLTHLDF